MPCDLQYYSAVASQNCSLAEATFHELQQYIHPYQWALDSPAAGPRNAEIESASRNRGVEGSHTFQRENGKTYYVKKFKQWVVEEAMQKQRKVYYVSKAPFWRQSGNQVERRRTVLLYNDVDLHQPWHVENDGEFARTLLTDLFDLFTPHGPRLFWLDSSRGQNSWFKVDLGNTAAPEANLVFDRLEDAIRLYLGHHKCWADFEIKGKISHFQDGKFVRKQFGKLPFSHPAWDDQKLQEFQATEAIPLGALVKLCDQIEEKIPAKTLANWNEAKRHRDEANAEKLLEQMRLGFPGKEDRDLIWVSDFLKTHLTVRQRNEVLTKVGVTGEPEEWIRVSTLRRHGQSVVSEKVEATVDPVSAPHSAPLRLEQVAPSGSNTMSVSHGRVVDQPLPLGSIQVDDLEIETDSFVRQAEFLRRLSRKLKRVPSVDEALEAIRNQNLFTGAWEDNTSRRRARVSQILRYISQTFDPSKCGQGNVETDKYTAWAMKKFPNGITGGTRTYMTPEGEVFEVQQNIHVSPEFIAVFMAVVNYCLLVDANQDESLPHDRAKALWKKLEGVVPFNDRKWAICRDYLAQAGIIDITDRRFAPGKAMRWAVGTFFPGLGLWKTKKVQRHGEKVSLADFLTALWGEEEKKEHNTFLLKQCHSFSVFGFLTKSRPPP